MKNLSIIFSVLVGAYLFSVSPALATPSQTTLYFGSREKVLDESGAVIEERTYLSLPYVTVVKSNEGTHYLHQDHLSSTRLITDSQGNQVAEYDYYPYGQLTTDDQQLTTDKLYTSQTKDNSTNLYYYHARYYNPQTAHFLSADSAEGPNRYSYVGGNPIVRNDPAGKSGAVPIWMLGMTEEELEYEAPEPENFWQELEKFGISLVYGISPWVPESWEANLSGTEKANVNLTSGLMMVNMVSVDKLYSFGHDRIVIDPQKDKSLRQLIARAEEYITTHRTDPTVSRAELVAEFLAKEVPYDPKGQRAIHNLSWRRFFSRARLGEFVNQAVCQEKSIMGHAILADLGEDSLVVVGKTATGLHAWVELLDAATGGWYVMEATGGYYMERAAYDVLLGVEKILGVFKFLKP